MRDLTPHLPKLCSTKAVLVKGTKSSKTFDSLLTFGGNFGGNLVSAVNCAANNAQELLARESDKEHWKTYMQHLSPSTVEFEKFFLRQSREMGFDKKNFKRLTDSMLYMPSLNHCCRSS